MRELGKSFAREPIINFFPLQQREKKELEKEITAMVEGMREQLVHAAAEAKAQTHKI